MTVGDFSILVFFLGPLVIVTLTLFLCNLLGLHDPIKGNEVDILGLMIYFGTPILGWLSVLAIPFAVLDMIIEKRKRKEGENNE